MSFVYNENSLEVLQEQSLGLIWMLHLATSNFVYVLFLGVDFVLPHANVSTYPSVGNFVV